MNVVINNDLLDICREDLDWSQFSNKNVLITGANGILASYIVETILMLIKLKVIHNTHVLALVRDKLKAATRFKDYHNQKNISFIVQDVSDPIVCSESIDIIIHAASQASPKYYGVDPVGTLTPNVIGTTNLLKLAKEKKVQDFIFFSSAEIYGNLNNSDAIKETDYGSLDPMNIRSCYAESKRMGENICSSWFSQFNVPVKIIRPFHTYGPGMLIDDGRIFSDFVFNILNNQNLQIKSDGSARRAYCYLKDAIIGYFYVILKGEIGEAYNVGNPYQEYSVKELADILISIFPEKSLNVEMNSAFSRLNYLPSTVNRFLPDTHKIEALGWFPKVDVKDGFQRTILSYS